MLYTVITISATIALLLLGEERPDVYLMMAILVYFTVAALLPAARREANLRVVDLLLFVVFVVSVALRVAITIGLYG